MKRSEMSHAEYTAIHRKYRKALPKPEVCPDCKSRPVIDLANISDDYHDSIDDWEWLCRSCHMKKDGRINNLFKGSNGKVNPVPKGSKRPLKIKEKVIMARWGANAPYFKRRLEI